MIELARKKISKAGIRNVDYVTREMVMDDFASIIKKRYGNSPISISNSATIGSGIST